MITSVIQYKLSERLINKNKLMDVPEKQIQCKKPGMLFSTNLGDMKDCNSFSNETFYTYRYSVNCVVSNQRILEIKRYLIVYSFLVLSVR